MVLKKGEVYLCNICMVEVKVTIGGSNTAPLTCCGIDMVKKQ